MDSTGFVIVSGTDDVLPILAYSTESIFDPDNIPPNMAEVLNRYKQEIQYVIDNNIASTQEITKQWNELISGKVANRKANAVSVYPLLGELKWNQAPIYNDSCPYDEQAEAYDGYRCPAGCVAIAMAQIIRYWEYPAHGTGSKCYLAEYGNGSNHYGNYGTLCADFENTTYDYTLMPNQLTSSSSDAEKQAVTQLIYHCGVALNMQYGPSASGAYTVLRDYFLNMKDGAGNDYTDARIALKNHFGYSQVQGISKDDYTETEWINILKEQLSNWQPVLCSGQDISANAGHAYVCDGYDSYNYFHFNWGWGGAYNGYCLVSSLIPGGVGIGGGAGNYSSGQQAIINIKAVKDEKNLGWVNSSDYINPKKDYDTLALILLPDTCLKIYSNQETRNASSIHGMGMIFDPYSVSFGEIYNPVPLFNKSYPYRLDTLQIESLYLLSKNGYNMASPDTLRIYFSYYDPYSGEPSNSDYRIVPLSSDPSRLALLPNVVKVGGNSQKGDGIRPAAINTIVVDYILTKEDTAEKVVDMPGYYNTKGIKIPLTYNNATVHGLEVPAGAVIGTMVKFLPGYDYEYGDTLCYGLVSGNQWIDDYPIRVNNTFAMAYLENSSYGDFFDNNGYNGVNFETKELRYQQFHSYLDSCYYLNEKYLPAMSYHIAYDITPVRSKLEIDTAVCGKFLYNGFTYNESGVYTRRFFTTAGDSIVVINLTVDKPVGRVGRIEGNAEITQVGTYTYFIDSVENAAAYQWSVSTPQWTVEGNGTEITLNIEKPDIGILTVKAISASGGCETEATLSIEFCHSLGAVEEIQGNSFITETGTYVYSIAPVENAVAYQWEVSNSEWSIIGSSTSTAVEVYINSASVDTLSVKVLDDCERYSQKEFTLQSNVSVATHEKDNRIQIYPNPVKDIVSVLIENNILTHADIHLYDIFGKQLDVQTITNRQSVIDMRSYSAGIYVLQIKKDSKTIQSFKIVKL
jgi:hypothetical protein